MRGLINRLRRDETREALEEARAERVRREEIELARREEYLRSRRAGEGAMRWPLVVPDEIVLP